MDTRTSAEQLVQDAAHTNLLLGFDKRTDAPVIAQRFHDFARGKGSFFGAADQLIELIKKPLLAKSIAVVGYPATNVYADFDGVEYPYGILLRRYTTSDSGVPKVEEGIAICIGHIGQGVAVYSTSGNPKGTGLVLRALLDAMESLEKTPVS